MGPPPEPALPEPAPPVVKLEYSPADGPNTCLICLFSLRASRLPSLTCRTCGCSFHVHCAGHKWLSTCPQCKGGDLGDWEPPQLPEGTEVTRIDEVPPVGARVDLVKSTYLPPGGTDGDRVELWARGTVGKEVAQVGFSGTSVTVDGGQELCVDFRLAKWE